jgi:hypothetical protein
MCIFSDNAKYLFKINDLINIINSSLSNNYLFFADPMCIKNPYNNIPFLKSTLYNIYLFIKYKTYFTPILFFYFFQCNFNIGNFKYKHEYLLRDYSIENYVYKSPFNIILKEIQIMIKDFNKECFKNKLSNCILIDDQFPSDKLIRIMKPYLFLYIYSKYTLFLYKKCELKNMLKTLLIRFNNYNPQFGRKKIKILMGYGKNLKKKIVGQIVEFDDNHIQFQDLQSQNTNFLQDHINYVNSNYFYNFNFNFDAESEEEKNESDEADNNESHEEEHEEEEHQDNYDQDVDSIS